MTILGLFQGEVTKRLQDNIGDYSTVRSSSQQWGLFQGEVTKHLQVNFGNMSKVLLRSWPSSIKSPLQPWSVIKTHRSIVKVLKEFAPRFSPILGYGSYFGSFESDLLPDISVTLEFSNVLRLLVNLFKEFLRPLVNLLSKYLESNAPENSQDRSAWGGL